MASLGPSLVNASKVAGFPIDVQQQLAADLRAGADPKTAVAARLTVHKADAPNTVVAAFLRSLERNLDVLEAEAEQAVWMLPTDIANLKRTHAFIGRLLRRVAKSPPRPAPRKGRRKGQS